MPLPIPSNNEDRAKFVSRCVSFLSDKGEFSDNKQRVAVCFQQWKKHTKSKAALLDKIVEERIYGEGS